jgi:threonine synthase
VLVITGEGLKTLDAVRGTFESHVIEPSTDAFEREFAGVRTAVAD